LAWTSRFFLEELQAAPAVIACHATTAAQMRTLHRFTGGETRPVHPH
jgi:hypothetical protein